MSRALRVFVNANPVEVAEGSTALDCVRLWKNEEGDAVAEGRRIITDSRGLPIDGATRAQAGSIYRTVTHRAADTRAE
jgi:hypothetical protein